VSTLVGTTGLLNIPVYWLIVGASHALQVRRAVREREQRELQLLAQLGEARLQALRAQLQPHFLFNALNTIAVLMHEDVRQAHRTLLQLSQLLRRALDISATPMVSLREELAFLDAYVEIETTRFEDRISFDVQVDEQLLDVPVPGLVLQPLVENAVRHGLAERDTQNRIVVRAERAGDRMRIEVRDNGRGMPGQPDEGIGLSNTRTRLDIHYGARHRFEILPAEGGGTLAVLELPL
jgi:LytS/YehU family sensor histidine kinase